MNKKQFNTLVFLISLTLSVVLAEVILQVYFPLTGSGNHHKLFCKYDSLLGWVKIPDFQGIHIGSEYSVIEKMNSAGIRGPEYSEANNENNPRIMILGDSFAEGYTVEYKDLFSEKLRANLDQSYRNIEVINSGTGGYSTDQEYLFLKTSGIEYKPDLVILMFYMNDVYYNNSPHYHRGSKPIFKYIDEQLVLKNIPVPEPLKFKNDRIDPFEKFEIYKRALIVSARIKYAMISSGILHGNKKIEKGNPHYYEELYVYKNNDTKHIAKAWILTEQLIIATKELTEAIGSEFMVFYINPREELYPTHWDNFLVKYGLDSKEFSVENPRHRLTQICNENDINLLDPTNQLNLLVDSLATINKQLFHHGDGHWNTEGNKIIADLLTNYISQNSLFNPSGSEILVTSSDLD